MEYNDTAAHSKNLEAITRVEIKTEPCWQEEKLPNMKPESEQSTGDSSLQDGTLSFSSLFIKVSDTEMHGDGKLEIKEEPMLKETSRKIKTEMEVLCVSDTGLQKEDHLKCIVAVDDFPADESSRLCTETVHNSTAGVIEKHKAIASESHGNTTQFSNPKGINCSELEVSEDLSESGSVYKCDICEKNFTRSHHLKRHKLIHKERTSYKCDVCEKTFTLLPYLKKHKLIHKEYRSYNCTICNKSFKDESHSLIHEGERVYKCNICAKGFVSASHLKRHTYIHNSSRVHKCEVCEKSFKTISDLRRHYFSHESKTPFKCTICNKAFKNRYYLKTHYFIHEGKRPHKCETCKKSFTTADGLRRHCLIHEGKRPHQCDICLKRFTEASSLKRHYLTHKINGQFLCAICLKIFLTASDLKQHHLIHVNIKCEETVSSV